MRVACSLGHNLGFPPLVTGVIQNDRHADQQTAQVSILKLSDPSARKLLYDDEVVKRVEFGRLDNAAQELKSLQMFPVESCQQNGTKACVEELLPGAHSHSRDTGLIHPANQVPTDRLPRLRRRRPVREEVCLCELSHGLAEPAVTWAKVRAAVLSREPCRLAVRNATQVSSLWEDYLRPLSANHTNTKVVVLAQHLLPVQAVKVPCAVVAGNFTEHMEATGVCVNKVGHVVHLRVDDEP